METSPDPAIDMRAPDSLTFGDLCYAIEKGRICYERCGSSLALRVHDIRRWGRREMAFRTLVAPLLTCPGLDMGGFA